MLLTDGGLKHGANTVRMQLKHSALLYVDKVVAVIILFTII